MQKNHIAQAVGVAAPTKQNAPHHPKAMESAALSKLHSATTMRAVNRLALAACTPMQARATVRLGASNTTQTAASRPERAALPRPKFTNAGIPVSHGYGLDDQSGNTWCTTVCVLLTSSPPNARSKAKGGFQQFKQELEAMTTINVASRCAAPTHQATPANITPTTTEETQAHALLQAVTSTNLAGFYLRRDNVAQARRKLRQALQALNALEVAA